MKTIKYIILSVFMILAASCKPAAEKEEAPKNNAIWLWGVHMKEAPIQEWAEKGYRHVLLNEAAFDRWGEADVYAFMDQCDKLGLTVHVWFQAFYFDGKWVSPIDDEKKAIKQDFYDMVIERAKGYVEKGVKGIHLDYIRYGGTAHKHDYVDSLFEAIVEYIPAPEGSADDPLKALIFDSHYDPYRGVIVHARIFSGRVKPGDEIVFMHSDAVYKTEDVGRFQLTLMSKPELSAGDVGYFIAGIKTISDIRVGDTVTLKSKPAAEPLGGFKEVKPVVFSSIYPVDSNDYEELQEAIDRLKLNDASLIYEKDSSAALGFGFRCGFLGMLHLEVIQERIEREFDLSIVFTSPSVRYIVHMKDGETLYIDNPLEYPDPMRIEYAEEPYITANIITPTDYVGPIISLCLEKRGMQSAMNYLDQKRVELIYDMPLAEVLFDFYDRLKSISRGYASFDYQVNGYKRTELVRMDTLVNGDPCDALSQLVFKGNAYQRGRQVCERLKDEIPRQQFKIAIQAAIGGNIIARETISAFRKDVTAKCYGGDISRKRKLLEKQKEGKKRMKMVGNVEIPQSAFLAVLKTDEDK